MEKKILVVDDEAPIRKMMTMAFTNKGYTVFSAENADQALEILSANSIHVVFTDLNMPGMNGVELCKKIKKDRPMSIVHAVTGYASIFELQDCRDAGCDDYFTKPVKMELLYKAAQEAFEKIERWRKR